MHENFEQITPIAVTNWRDIRKIFGIKQKNRRGHMYIIGKTGTGKTTLLANMAISDIKQGNGLAVIDPHGDLSETILSHIPKERISDAIYFNPGDLEYPIAFNPLRKVPPDLHHLVVSGLISTFKKIWSDFWGPRLEHILRQSLFTLLEYPDSTLLDISRLLTEKEYRLKVLASVKNPHVLKFWKYEFDTYSKWLRSEAISPILNKVGQFLTNLPLRNILGQVENTFSMREVMDQGKILIVNLSKGKIGEDNSTVLGSLILNQLYLAAVSRANIPEDKRKAFYLYVDEFHNFITLSFADMLSESRKYGLNLIFAHQYIKQLLDKIKDAIFGNIGTLISFKVGVDDAYYLAKEFGPTFSHNDLIALPNFELYIKLMIDGITSKAFSASTLPLPIPQYSFTEDIIGESRKQYCTKRGVIEQRTNSTIDVNQESEKKQKKLF